jgi:hypothetical protein
MNTFFFYNFNVFCCAVGNQLKFNMQKLFVVFLFLFLLLVVLFIFGHLSRRHFNNILFPFCAKLHFVIWKLTTSFFYYLLGSFDFFFELNAVGKKWERVSEFFFSITCFLSTLLLTFHIPVYLSVYQFIYMFQIQVPSSLFQTFHMTLKS